MPKFSQRSLDNLATADFRLSLLFKEVVREVDCTIICGHRGKEEQEEAYRTGRSKAQWGQSKHNAHPSRAVDVMPYPIDWNDRERLFEFAGYVKGVASQLGIKVKWGGDFDSFFDGPHWELGEHDG